jgi:hypothetical protein
MNEGPGIKNMFSPSPDIDERHLLIEPTDKESLAVISSLTVQMYELIITLNVWSVV